MGWFQDGGWDRLIRSCSLSPPGPRGVLIVLGILFVFGLASWGFVFLFR